MLAEINTTNSSKQKTMQEHCTKMMPARLVQEYVVTLGLPGPICITILLRGTRHNEVPAAQDPLNGYKCKADVLRDVIMLTCVSPPYTSYTSQNRRAGIPVLIDANGYFNG